ncbi:MAG TPA: Grx4 family monothiol glutaredoxin [Deltaproteobacteria bacterium]|nr:monothiol glutaredoxin, Grx4 family [Deltaproteobacteria bacterium]HCP44836.1 Grx4 family monothiol glutaredoxin [Deltaproteobacteria bacterium]
MGILSRIKRRLPIVGGDREPRPSEAWTPPTSTRATSPAAEPPPPPPPPRTADEVRSEIEEDVKNHPIVLYMKGSERAPQCGFSAAVVDMLQQLAVPFETRDVIADPVLRQVIKDYSDWPTLPQLYLGGEFVGGCDIVREMHEQGELKKAVEGALQGA